MGADRRSAEMRRNFWRELAIWCERTKGWGSAFAHSPSDFAETKGVEVQPFHSHAHIDFDGLPNYTPRGHIGLDIDVNPDLSVTVSWSASEFDDETEGGSVDGGANVAKNGPQASNEPQRTRKFAMETRCPEDYACRFLWAGEDEGASAKVETLPSLSISTKPILLYQS
jgi:hypothetical protein